jgi:hypothetical protein
MFLYLTPASLFAIVRTSQPPSLRGPSVPDRQICNHGQTICRLKADPARKRSDGREGAYDRKAADAKARIAHQNVRIQKVWSVAWKEDNAHLVGTASNGVDADRNRNAVGANAQTELSRSFVERGNHRVTDPRRDDVAVGFDFRRLYRRGNSLLSLDASGVLREDLGRRAASEKGTHQRQAQGRKSCIHV